MVQVQLNNPWRRAKIMEKAISKFNLATNKIFEVTDAEKREKTRTILLYKYQGGTKRMPEKKLFFSNYGFMVKPKTNHLRFFRT